VSNPYLALPTNRAAKPGVHRSGYGPLFDKLRQHLDDGQIVELTHHIALENMRGRFNLALGIGPVGFSDGMVCAVPVVHP
jgi:hypothetical protein